MITIEIPTVLRSHAAERAVVQVADDCGTVRDALRALESVHPGVVDRVLTEQGQLREHVNVFLESENVKFLDGLATRVPPRSTLVILAAVSGG